MYERRNAYLKRREQRREERDYARRDYARRYDMYPEERDYRSRDMRRDMRRDRTRRDYGRDYGRDDYGDYHYEDYDYRDSASDEYKADLKELINKLKRNDRFGVSKQQILEQAKNMGVDFKDYDEDEFYAVYLMMVSDYKTISNEYNMYIKLAKEWLEDDDIAVEPSEKLCIYLYEIILGEE